MVFYHPPPPPKLRELSFLSDIDFLRSSLSMPNSIQIMTGLEGNRQIYFPGEIQDRLPKRNSTMGLITKKHICLNDHKLFLRIIMIMKNNIKLKLNLCLVETFVNSESVY